MLSWIVVRSSAAAIIDVLPSAPVTGQSKTEISPESNGTYNLKPEKAVDIPNYTDLINVSAPP